MPKVIVSFRESGVSPQEITVDQSPAFVAGEGVIVIRNGSGNLAPVAALFPIDVVKSVVVEHEQGSS
jgi:hypothetical protein